MKQIVFTIIFAILSIATYAQPTWVTSGAPIGNESNFTYTGNTTMTFDGTDDEINIGASLLSTTVLQDYTFSAWINIADPTFTNDHTIFSQDDGVAFGSGMMLMTVSGKLAYMRGIFTPITASSTTVTDGAWHHVAFVRKAGVVTLYVDGVAEGTPGADATNYAAATNYLGRDGTPFFRINGKMDNVKIWDVALTDVQIFNAMYGTYAPEADIIAVYDFQEGSGTTLTDVSANSYNGTIAGTPTWNSNDEIVSELKIKDNKGDILTVNNFGSPSAAQIYKVNDTPNDITLANGAGSLIEGHYWGVFPANGTASYDIELMYDGYKTWTDESQLDLAYRNNNASGAWTNNLDASLDMPNNTLTKTGISSRNEYHLMYEIPPEPGNCLQFDGTDAWVSVPTNGIPNWSAITTFTIELWIQPTANDACNIFEGATGDSDISLEGTASGGYNFYLNNTNCGTTGALDLNRWYHVALSFDDLTDEANLYLDGVLQSTTTYAGTSQVFGNFLYLGDRQTGGFDNNARDFPGYIDELRVWQDVRTATEIQDHMHKELSASELADATTFDLMAYYDFNHFGNTTVVTDRKGNNDGTLQNDASNADGETTGPIWRESNCFNRWWGITDGTWANRDNWSKGRLPLTTDNVGIHQIKATPDVVQNALTLSTGTLTEVNDFTVGSSATFTANAGEQLTVNDPYTVNGTSILVSPSSNGPSASLITLGPVQGTGETQAQRYISADNWHYFSSPVVSQNSSVFSDNQNLYYWDETIADHWTGNNFVNNIMGWTSFSGNFAVGTGYICHESSSEIKSFNGLVNSGNVTATLDYMDNTATHSNAMFDGWNLVGNPYPSAIDWQSGDITKNNIDAAIYFYDDNGTGNFDNYRYYVDGGADDDYYPAIAANEGSRYIPAHQSVFIKSATGGGSVTFSNTSRVHSTTDFYKSSNKSEIEQEVIRMELHSGNLKDETVIRFLDDANITDNYDGNADAYKLFSNASEVPQIFSVVENNSFLAINSLPFYDEETVIPFGVRGNQNQTHQIVFTEVPENLISRIYLEDKTLNKFIEIENGLSYEFQLSTNELINNRFQIVFEKEQAIWEQETNENAKIFSFSNTIYIQTSTEYVNSQIEIYNFIGQKVYEGTLLSTHTQIPMHVASGNYLVKVVKNDEVIIEKVFVGDYK